MKVAIIGAGNLATQLAFALHENGTQIVQIFSRTEKSAQALATAINAPFITNIKALTPDADFYIFTVKDSILPNLLNQTPKNNGIWIHTAGSLPLEIFHGKTDNYGILYPFQTFSKNRKVEFQQIPIFIEANNADTLKAIELLSCGISGFVYPLSSEKRKYIHLTGVFACNFVNHMYHISEHILKESDIPFRVVLPLINETAKKINELSPAEAQTGPAIRMDSNVIDAHLALLRNKQHKELYRLLSNDIYTMNKTKDQ
ncbi:MAG: Rossmann-like and DUF2520 domain-containing protein [Dysgonomonas sp.]